MNNCRVFLRTMCVCALVGVLSAVASAWVGPDAYRQGAPALPALAQTTITLSPVSDADIDATEPDSNAGSSASLRVYYGGLSEEGRALVRFNLAAAVPPGAVIDAAHLELYLQSGDGADPVTLTAACLTEDWTESTVTWNTQPAAGDPTTTALVDMAVGYKSLDITEIVQAWHNVPHYGLVLSGAMEDHGRVFGSREYGAEPPRLVVTYHMPAVELLAVEDVTLDSDAPSVNLGDELTLGVGWSSDDGGEHIQRTLLRFPALDLPAGAWVGEAWLELAQVDGEGGVVARVTEDWSEYDVTWQTQPGYDRPLADPQPGETARWDVTALVNGWQLGLYPDHGLALLETAGTPGAASYSSRQGSQSPRLVIDYTLGMSSTEEFEPAPPPGLGPPSFVVDPGLVPFSDTLAPMLVGGEPITRPLAVLQAEQGRPFTFIADEVIYTPASPGALEAFLATYGGRVLREPGLPEPLPGFEGETRDIEPDPGYLIQVDPMLMNLDSLEADASALGLVGEIRLSSDAALHLLALVLHERNNDADVSLDGVGQFVADPSFPSLAFEEEPIAGGFGGFEDPINEFNHYPEMGDTTVQRTGVNRAWQYVAFANRASTGVRVAIIDGGFCLNSSGGRCTDASGRLNIDLPANFMQYDFNDDDYNASGANPMPCSGGSSCPHHGSSTTSIATANQDNRYGIAGVGSPVARPMMFKIGGDMDQCTRAIRTAVKCGAKIINMSWKIECDWACRFFSGISGYGKFKDAMSEADAAGVLTVSSAGNDDKDLSDEFFIPCVLTWNSFCVGALAENSRDRASFSNWGTCSATPLGTGGVNIWAPGSSIRVGPDLAASSNHVVSGTSLSAPFVSGAAALAWGVNPNLTHKQVRGLILNTRNAPLNSTVAPGSINVMKLVMNAGQPLWDRLGYIGYAGKAAIITETGISDLTIRPGEVDYFEYQADNYLLAQFTATYVEPLGDLYVGAHKPAMMASKVKASGTRSSTYSITSKDLCIGDQYGEEFIFYVKGVNPAVGNAYSLTVQTTLATSLGWDKNEPNDTEVMATVITAPRESAIDFLTTERIDCRNGLTLDSPTDTDFYTFTVEAADLSVTEHYTGVCVSIDADFPITATLTQGGTILETEYARYVELKYGPVQPGGYLLQVWGPTLNAYTLRVRVCNPVANERANDLKKWLEHATQPQPPKLLPDCLGGCDGLPIWLRKYVWDPATFFALEANHVLPVDQDLGFLSLELSGSPHVFALGSSVGGELNVSLGPGLGMMDAAHRTPVQAEGVYALLQDAEGNELWRVEGALDDVNLPAEMEAGQTYLLLVNGEAGTQAHLSVDLPGKRVYLPLVLR
jgi:hypothetical protein